MIAKGKILTLYEPNEQVPVPGLQTVRTAPTHLSTDLDSNVKRGVYGLSSPDSEAESVASSEVHRMPTSYESDFRMSSGNGDRTIEPPPGEPPDPKSGPSFLGRIFGRLFQRRRKG